MNNELSLYHNMLFLDLRPWKKRDVSESKYKELLLGLSKEAFSFQPLYEVVFEKPLTAKRKYYHALIESEAARYLNDFHSIIAGAEKVNEKKYWVHTTLTKVISQKLKETSKAIEDNQYFLEQLLTKTKSKSIAAYIFDETYIIQFLKYQLIRIYLEIQQAFQNYLKEDAVSEAELQSIYFLEPCPVESYLKPAKENILLKPSAQKIKPNTEITFKVEKREIRDTLKGVLHYKDIVEKIDHFARVEIILFEQKLIDQNYQFKTTQGNISKMAAVYRVLFNSNFFKSITFSNNAKVNVTDLHVKKFLNNRYATNIDKEFRNFKDPALLKPFLSNNLWISFLPSS